MNSPYPIQFGYTFYTVRANLDGVSHTESLRAPQPAGNCLNWVLGHLVNSRDELLGALGAAKLWDAGTATLYRRSSAPLTDTSDAAPFDELERLFERQQEALLAAFATLTPDRLAEPAPFSPGKRPDETLDSLIAAFAFHEAYHAGQIGLLRRLLGKPGALT